MLNIVVVDVFCPKDPLQDSEPSMKTPDFLGNTVY